MFLLIYASAIGQGEFSLYTLNNTVPQAHQLNPSFYPDGKVFVGLPVFASTHATVDMDRLSFDNVFSESPGRIQRLDYEKISSRLEDSNHFTVNTDVQLFFFGLNVKNAFFSLAVNDRVDGHVVYSKDIANLALFGNRDSRTFGKNIWLHNIQFKQNVWHEYALGFAGKISEKFRMGVRFKLLFGVLNSQSEDVGGYIYTDSTSMKVSGTNMEFRNSGFNELNDYYTGEFSIYRSPLPYVQGNNGYALDFGASFQPIEKINISASIVDLGFINWETDTRSYRLNDITYEFTGFDANEIVDDEDDTDFFQNELDSLENLVTTEEVTGLSYRSQLTVKYYAGIDYRFSKMHRVGALFYSRTDNGKITPEWGLFYNLQAGRILNAVVNASFRNGSINAAGIGASLNFGPAQIYATTESVTSLVQPEAANFLDFRLGVNLIFSKRTKTKEERKLEKMELKVPKKEQNFKSLEQWKKWNVQNQFQLKVKMPGERKKKASRGPTASLSKKK